MLRLKGSGPVLPDCVASVAHDSGQSCPVRFLTWKWAQHGGNVLGLPEGPRGRPAQARVAGRHLFLSLSPPRVLQLPVLGSKRKRGFQVKAEAGPEALRFSMKYTGTTTPDEAASVRTFAFRQRPQAAPAGPRPALGRAGPRLLPAGCWSTARSGGPCGGGARGRGRGPPPRVLAPPGTALAAASGTWRRGAASDFRRARPRAESRQLGTEAQLHFPGLSASAGPGVPAVASVPATRGPPPGRAPGSRGALPDADGCLVVAVLASLLRDEGDGRRRDRKR